VPPSPRPKRKAPILARLRVEDFEQRIGERFRVKAAGGRAFTLELISVDALEAPAGRGRTPFSLEFRHRAARSHVPQQTLAVEHPELGAFDLFVVPLGPGPVGMRYEAIFT
jgi:hypothetical protein